MSRVGGIRALLAAAVVCAAPALAEAQSQQYGQPPSTYTTWGDNNIGTQYIDVTYFIGGGFTANQENLLRSAAAAWNGSGAAVRIAEVFAPGADVDFSRALVPGFQLADVNITTVPGAGTYPNGDPWAQIQPGATIIVNNGIASWDGVGAQAGIDFEALALNLFGQALGLGLASGDPTSVMQPDANYSFVAPGNQSLSPSDIAAIQAVYGTPEPATLALFGVGLLVLAFTKRSWLS